MDWMAAITLSLIAATPVSTNMIPSSPACTVILPPALTNMLMLP